MARATTNDIYEKGVAELRAIKEQKQLEEQAKFEAEIKRKRREGYMTQLREFEPEWLTNTVLPTLRLNNVPRRGGGSRKLIVAIGGEICGWVFGNIAMLIVDSGILEAPEAKVEVTRS